MSFEMQAANNVITFELFRQERRSVSSCIANQKLAYNLVVHSIDILQCIRQGTDPGRTTLAFSTLWNMATMIKTNFGTDMEAAGGTYDLFAVDLNRPRHQHTIPLQGLGQGNGYVIASYTIVTAPAYNMLSKKRYVATFTMRISGTKILFHGTVFVDDDDGVITADFENLMEEIADQAQKGSVSK